MPEVSSQDLEIIVVKLDQVRNETKEIREKVGDIRRGLYDPENGLFSQVKELRLKEEEHEKHSEEMREDIDKVVKSIPESAAKIGTIETWQTDHDTADEELKKNISIIVKNMEPLTFDYKTRMANKTWADKIKWLIGAFFLTTVMATAVAMIKQTFIDDNSNDRLERIEKKLENRR